MCSILCLAWDQISNIQFASENSPANWYSDYKYEPAKKVYIENLSSQTLLECLKIEDEEEKLFNDFFENDLKDALEFVKNDLDESNKDSNDILTQQTIAKRRKLCDNNHINYDVKSNRKICDRQYCKANLKMDSNIDIQSEVEKKITDNKIDKEALKAKTYMNVPRISCRGAGN